eukprot:1210861-Pyramimonas_sp.AAC.1
MHSTPQRPSVGGLLNITSFYGSSCANNGKDALNTPDHPADDRIVPVSLPFSARRSAGRCLWGRAWRCTRGSVSASTSARAT